jgi:hypothetical protein
MVKFFLRNSPDTIKAAVDLSREDFIEKFKETTASREILFKAYDEIRAVHIPKNQTKEVKFKVVQTDKKVVPFNKPVAKKEEEETEDLPELSDGQQQEQMWTEAQREVDFKRAEKGSMLIEGELPEGSIIGKVESITADELGEGIQINDALEIAGSGKTVLDPVRVKKSNRGRRRLKNADNRDARILELLKKGEKGQDIIKILTKEGFTVHAPQITQIKQANLEDINAAIDALNK